MLPHNTPTASRASLGILAYRTIGQVRLSVLAAVFRYGKVQIERPDQSVRDWESGRKIAS